MDIKSLINKVIASKGILRVPSWWMKKLLTEIVEYIDSRDSANANSIVKVKKEADSKITDLGSEIKFDLLNLKRSLHTQKCFVVKTGASASYVVVDGVAQDIPANTQKIIYFTDTFRFSPVSGMRYQPIEFIGLAVTDVSTMTSMERMFSDCEKLTSIDLSGLDTSAVTNMNSMFHQCSEIESINLSGINVSSVTSMRWMFGICKKLTSIDLSGFDTSSLTDVHYMFGECRSLKSIDLSGFNTSSVTDMGYMFSECNSLKSIDLSGFNTSKVTSMAGMFSACEKFTSLDLSSFNTSLVTNMYRMFSACEKLTSIDLSGFDTSKVTNMEGMFGGYRYDGDTHICGFTSLDLSSFNTSLVTNMYSMFSYCSNLVSLNLSSFDTSSVIDMNGMFRYCISLTSLLLGPNFFKTSAVTSIDISDCSKWTNDTVFTSLVTNSYDRASAGLNTLTVKLHANTKAVLSNEQKAVITSKGYTIA